LLTLSGLAGVLGIALIEGATVAAPRAGALSRLERLRSPVWAGLLPGVILIGTFGVLALPRFASGLVLLGAIATPILAAVAALAVLRGTRAGLALTALAAGIPAAVGTGWIAQLSQTFVTALGCIAAGAAVVRLVPRAWLGPAVLSMCAVDVLLLAVGLGQPAGALMAGAASHVHLPPLDKASIGPITTDYPDLVLAAVLGSVLGGGPGQRSAAVLVAALVAGYGMLLPIAGTLPATVPIALAFVLIRSAPLVQRCRAVAPRAQEAPA
jgi:hypothetical protein